MNFDPVYLREVRQYCDNNSYLLCLPQELQTLIGKYLLYIREDNFKIEYWPDNILALSLYIGETTHRGNTYECNFTKRDQSALKIFLEKLIANESTVLSFRDEDLLKLRVNTIGWYTYMNIFYKDNKVAMAYSSASSLTDNSIIIRTDQPKYIKLSMLWLKALEVILHFNFD